MKPFTSMDGLVAPIDRVNVDTDAIIPKQFMKSIRRTGFGQNLFDEWRYLDHGEPDQECSARPLNPNFALNQARYHGAQILLVRENFGCGSSREHAVWALSDYGIRVLIGPSFADIFAANCAKNGILTISLDPPIVEELFMLNEGRPGFHLNVDLEAQVIGLPDSCARAPIAFAVEEGGKRRLLAGIDEIAMTLQSAKKISDYEVWRSRLEPWLGITPVAGNG